MQAAFQRLADDLMAGLTGDEVLLCSLHGEDSDFVRFSRGRIRQAGAVRQERLSLELIQGRRHAGATATLSGDHDVDLARLRAIVSDLRERLPMLPEDPYLSYATEARSTERNGDASIPAPDEAVDRIRSATDGFDLVGVYASGGIHAGFASSLGQRNWFDTQNFNFDWSFYHAGDKAVKTAYAGQAWDDDAFGRKVVRASKQLDALKRAPHTIQPGRYRVYLAPAAIHDIVGLLAWGGFGLKALKTGQSPLVKLAAGEAELADAVSILENTAEGFAPEFQGAGFLRPPSVSLVQSGRYAESLVSPRSAMEYGVATNGASSMETPESVDVAPGTLPDADVLQRLGTGIYVGNVWYLNYSDRPGCRATGMTRFATFWVEDGEIAAPLEVMRFDETVYRMLGENLVGLTAERELVLDPGSYVKRATSSGRFPGALVEDLNFTL